MTEMRDKIAQAIEKTIGENEPGLVTKWVALVESVGADGEKGLWTLASQGIKTWETSGMLKFGLDLETARTVESRLRDED